MAKTNRKQAFKVKRDIANTVVHWFAATDETLSQALLTARVSDIEDEHRPLAREFFTCYGMQKFLEDRTSGEPTENKVQARRDLWKQICEHGHTWKAERSGGLGVVDARVAALAELQGVRVDVIQIALREQYPEKEERERVLNQPRVLKRAEEIRAEREEASSLDLENLD